MSSSRKALLVGSLPYENESEAMRRSLQQFGAGLIALPDGEIGEKSETYPDGVRSQWIASILDRCERDTAAWRVVRPSKIDPATGFADDYATCPKLKPKYPPGEMHKHVDFGWLDYFKASYPVFRELREKFGLPDLKFQVGLPTGLGSTFAMLGPVGGLRYAPAFNRRLAWEANEMLRIADKGDLLFQLEVPGELKLAYVAPKIFTGFALRTVIGLVKLLEPEAPIGVHFCFGDFNNKALIENASLDRLVHFSNTLVRQWPRSHELAFLHYPLAEADEPPPVDRAFYEPLRNLIIPEGTRFVAGFVHEKRSSDEHQEILRLLSSIRPETIDVACSCGLGRRNAEITDRLFTEKSQLMAMPT